MSTTTAPSTAESDLVFENGRRCRRIAAWFRLSHLARLPRSRRTRLRCGLDQVGRTISTRCRTWCEASSPQTTLRSLSASGMRRSTLLELSGMELHEVAHVRRCFAGELAHGVRHAIVTPLPGQLGHGREMPDEVLRKPRLPKAFAPRREWDVAISDGPAERR
jgi:hypothetical protein